MAAINPADLEHRAATAGAHPIAAITGLQLGLDAKASAAALTAHVNATASVHGLTNAAGLIDKTGTPATDLPTFSGEFLDAENWTLGAGWTGDFGTGFTHAKNSGTAALTHDHQAAVGTLYQVTYTVTGRTSGSFALAFGGQSISGISSTGTFGPKATTTDPLTITPTTDFDGTLVVRIKAITGASTPILTFRNSAGSVVGEMRAPNQGGCVAVGYYAGSSNTTGYLTAVGHYAGASNTTGALTAVGHYAGRYNTTGTLTAVGHYAGLYNTTGTLTAVGHYAAYSNTTGYLTAVGHQAGYSNTTGYLTAVGYYAGSSNTTGALSAVGHYAGTYLADGATGNATPAECTYIGRGTRASVAGAANETVIGYAAIGGGSNTVRLGNSSVTAWLPGATNKAALGDATTAFMALYLSDGTDEWRVTINTSGTLVTTKVEEE
ncbi:MAG: hypothetical protein ABFC80_02640 [Coriobacteriales bacterium]